ncbi:unnamed protein product [Eruca vesicaria subsp. sativa]|uniref:Peptidase A1 domain-containing protein n=1 Tax=Eruca vesicaria subsp. sativa TaxID=29727 RepID=A0ABC8L4P1_ERUVS|nr:unnamed protein product [Eruca vesicaria subsp. sativa]
MGGLTHLIIFISIFASITLISEAQYLLPINKAEPYKQYYTAFDIGSVEKSYPTLILDLETKLSWLNCRQLKSLKSLRLISCKSSTCKSIPGSGCDRKYCQYRQPNPLGKPVTGRVVQDKATFSTTDGGRQLSQVSLPRFTFSCATQGLSLPMTGVLGLSPARESPFWRQVTTAFNVIPKFALCLPSSVFDPGHFYVGGVNSYNIPPFNGSNRMPMTLTPLKNIDSGKYVISVESIYVGGVPLSLNPSLLQGGAKISTVVPYTVLQTDIYKALASAFTREAKKIGMSQVPGMYEFPGLTTTLFEICFDEGTSKRNVEDFMNVPVIEIGLPGRAGEVKWRFHGANTVVRVLETVICLAFVDGGKKPNEPMVIGSHQLQDYMIEFDLSTTRMAFSESLLSHKTSCSAWPSRSQSHHSHMSL